MAEESFPRMLTSLEKDLLFWLLPESRPGYNEYRSLVSAWKVASRGRRGEGNYILAAEGAEVDNDSPLPQIFAYGIVETMDGNIAVSIRERLGDQIEFEINSLRQDVLPQPLRETRRWTYSTWLPQEPCPGCKGTVREVEMKSTQGRRFILALCSSDERIWVYDAAQGVNHPIPLTNFYNELMLHANIRDPNIALNARRLFADLRDYSDADLTKAFISYNNLKTKIAISEALVIPAERKPTFFRKLRSRIMKT